MKRASIEQINALDMSTQLQVIRIVTNDFGITLLQEAEQHDGRVSADLHGPLGNFRLGVWATHAHKPELASPDENINRVYYRVLGAIASRNGFRRPNEAPNTWDSAEWLKSRRLQFSDPAFNGVRTAAGMLIVRAKQQGANLHELLPS